MEFPIFLFLKRILRSQQSTTHGQWLAVKGLTDSDDLCLLQLDIMRFNEKVGRTVTLQINDFIYMSILNLTILDFCYPSSCP